MCRLLGWASRRPLPLADLLGRADLDAFTELSCTHGDGWGAAHAGASGVEVLKRPDAARESDAFADWTARTASDLGMVHLRWATLGLPVRAENTHPFTDGRVAFAHNGSISPPSSLDALLTPGARAAMGGDTDSERYFLAVLGRIRAGEDPAAALAGTAREIADRCTFTSLNAVLLTPDRLLAVCRNGPGADRHAEGPDYFSLRYRVTDDAVVVASSGWGSGWRDLADGELLEVDRTTLRVAVHPLTGVAAAQ